MVPALQAALGTGAPLTLASVLAPTVSQLEVPVSLRELAVTSGCAADYDQWLT